MVTKGARSFRLEWRSVRQTDSTQDIALHVRWYGFGIGSLVNTLSLVGGLTRYSFYLAGNTSLLLTFATHASFSTAFSRATLSFYLFYTIATGIAACVLLPSVYDTPLF